MGTTNRRGIAQKISKDSMRGEYQFNRTDNLKGKRKEPGFIKTKLSAFLASFAALFGRGGAEIHIGGKVPTISCACGCGEKSFAATYYNLTHAVLHKRELSIQ